MLFIKRFRHITVSLEHELFDIFGGIGVRMWAADAHTGWTYLVHVHGNLTANVLPIIENVDAICQHDNAWSHIARLITTNLQANNIPALPWPSKYPALNSIEHMSDELDRRVRQRHPQPQNLPQLAQALHVEWATIPQRWIRNIVASFGIRCQAVFEL